MKHGQNNRRNRSRSNGKRYPNQRGGAFESNGPEVKVRGTAQQVFEKYLSLARDAASAGDRIASESYMQHAEHYHRIISAEAEAANGGRPRPQQPNRGGYDDYDDDGTEYDANDQPIIRPEAAPEQPEPATGRNDIGQSDGGRDRGNGGGRAVDTGNDNDSGPNNDPASYLPPFIVGPVAEAVPAEAERRPAAPRRGRPRARRDKDPSDPEQSAS